MKIVLAPDSFKGTLSADSVCRIVGDTIRALCPRIKIVAKPMADGGEGTAAVLLRATGGQWIRKRVMGPLAGMRVAGGFGWIEQNRTAIVEIAAACGLPLLTAKDRNPAFTTTYGAGELMKAALARRPKTIFLTLGGSATVDGGIGAAIALGWQFLDDRSKPIGLGGGEILRIRTIIPPAKKNPCKVIVLCDVENPLYGPNGAAPVFGPQKGASPRQVVELDNALARLAAILKTQHGIDVATLRGGGAAGGFGAGAAAFMDAKIVSGIDAVIRMTGLKKAMRGAQWVITGEGRLDRQSLQGKVVAGIVRAARQTHTPVAVISGCVALDKRTWTAAGIAYAGSCKQPSMTPQYAMQHAEELLTAATDKFAKKYLLKR